MDKQERLMTLKNIGSAPVSLTWDNQELTWAPGEERTLVYGVALHCRDSRPSDLTVVGESFGHSPEVVAAKAEIVNRGSEAVTVAWDGIPYTFEPEKIVVVDATIAHPVMTNARTLIAQEKLDARLELVTAGVHAEPEAEQATEPEKPKRRSRKAKQEEV